MKNKNWIWLILGIIFIAVVVFLVIKSTMKVDESPISDITKPTKENEVPKIEYQEDPNFYQDHPKGVQFSVGITGEEMNEKTLEENALIWGVAPDEFVSAFNSKFSTNAKASDILGEVLQGYDDYNRDVKIILENLK